MASGGLPQAFELGLNISLRTGALNGSLLLFLSTGPIDDDFVLSIVFIEQSTFVVDGAGSDFHLDGMLLGGLFDLLEMLVITVLSEPSDDVAFGPVDLEGVRVLVVNVIL